VIERYRFGAVVIDGREYTSDVIVLPGKVLPNWWRREGHLLQMDDLQEALSEAPEILIVGTGSQERMRVADEVAAHARRAGIELVAYDTPTACRMFNQVVEQRRAVACLHLTC